MTQIAFKLAIAWLLAFSSFQSVGAEEPIRTMSFNIRYGKANDGDNHWRTRHQLVLKTIKDYKPDLLGTQETLNFQAEYLQKNLPKYASFGRSREKDPNQGEQCTVFYLKSRFELLDKGQFWLSEKPEEIGSKSWDSSLPRIATWVKLKDRSNKRTFIFLNTHFDHRGKVARHESAKLIARRVAEFKLPTIITGDFNSGENSDPYKALVKNRMTEILDSFRAKYPEKQKGEGTFNSWRGTDSGARIDWVLSTSEFDVKQAAINKFNENGKYPSDHFPVTASLQFK